MEWVDYPVHYPVHYHITMRSQRDGTKVEIVEEYELSRQKFEKTIQLLQDLSGGVITYCDTYSALFENGDVIRWRPCDKRCLLAE